jgi:hypothetical protein
MPLSKRYTSDIGSREGYYFQIARVKSVVMGPYKGGTNEVDTNYNDPSDIGSIKYELLYSPVGISRSEEVNESAYPIFGFIKQYPLINEIVLILAGPTEKLNDRADKQRSYYFPPYDLWNHPNHGAFPNMEEWKEYLNEFVVPIQYQGTAVTSSLPLGYAVTEKKDVRNLRPFEGDTILQPRWGQSIRFGSTITTMKNSNNWSNSGQEGDPITMIVNSQGKRITRSPFDPIVEDINKDGSSIYLTSTQEINLTDINNFPLASFGGNINPITQPVIGIQRVPISDETISAQFQDENIPR